MPPLPWLTSELAEPNATYSLTMTRLPLRSYARIPRVSLATMRVVRALRKSEGLIGFSLKADLFHKTFWTVSAWRDDEALRAFARSDTHLAAMTKLQPHMDGPRIETVDVRGSELPPRWRDIVERFTGRRDSSTAASSLAER